MPSATLTSKGQITLPKLIRERLGLTTGDRVAFRERPDGSVVLEPETVDLASLRGRIRPSVCGVSIDDMSAGVKRAIARRYRRKGPMIGVDTNVLVRYLVEDDEEQTKRADALFRPGQLSGPHGPS